MAFIPDKSPPKDRATLRFGAQVVAVVGLAFLVRLLYLLQIQEMPLFTHLIGDGATYWAWAGRIAAGDWIGSETFYQAPAYPYFLAVVRLIFGDDLWRAHVVHAALGAVACGLLAFAGRAFLSPRAGLYTGVLMALYAPAIFFDGLIQKATLDLVLMAGLLCLLGWMTKRQEARGKRQEGKPKSQNAESRNTRTREEARGKRQEEEGAGRPPGAELGSAGASPSPTSHATVGADLACGTPSPRGGAWRDVVALLAAGVVLGLMALTREQTLLLAGVVLLWVLLRRAEAQRSWIPAAASFLVGIAVVLGPVAWRNYRVGGAFVLTTVQAGPNFYIGNHAGATGRYLALRPGAEWPPLEQRAATELAEAEVGHPLSPRAVSHFWLSKSWDYIRREPLDWLGLLVHKWVMVWNAYELSDTESFTLYAHLSWLLGALGRLNHFGVLWPLAAVGLAATLRQWRRLWVLVAMILTVAGGVALFYVFARYRYPLVPLLAVFAGAGVVEIERIVRWAAARRTSTGSKLPVAPGLAVAPGLPAWATCVIAAVVAVSSNLRLEHQRLLDATAYENWGVILGEDGNATAAAYLFTEALRHRPESAELHVRLGVARAAEGRGSDALAEFTAALKLDPRLAGAHYQLGLLFAGAGQMEGALEHLQEAVRLEPGFAPASFQLGVVCARTGRLDEAIAAYRQALQIEPANAAAHYNIGALLEHQGRTDDALAEYRAALAIDPNYARAREALARHAPP
jgi:Flp pilus assembly protein TadD